MYKTEKTQLNVFLDTTRSILQTLAGHAQEVEKIIHDKFRNSVDIMPRGTRHITLLYHQVRVVHQLFAYVHTEALILIDLFTQCVIVATRPLLLSALMERLDNLERDREYCAGFLDLIKTLITTGIKSASKTLQILSNSDSLLGTLI